MDRSRIIMKHMFHSARDQDFEYEIDLEAKTVNVYVSALDTVLLKDFLYNVLDRHVSEYADDYKITLIIKNQMSLRAALRRSEYKKSEDTVVLSLLN